MNPFLDESVFFAIWMKVHLTWSKIAGLKQEYGAEARVRCCIKSTGLGQESGAGSRVRG